MKAVFYSTSLMLLLISAEGMGQESKGSALYRVLKEKDSLLFDAAFNRCDGDALKNLFAEDLEFYHDKGGTTLGLEVFIKNFESQCAKRIPGKAQPSKRILIEEHLRVYPLNDGDSLYGAIQEGVHRFEFLNDKGEYQKGDIARFTHVWLKEKAAWKLGRVLSYDHHLYEQ